MFHRPFWTRLKQVHLSGGPSFFSDFLHSPTTPGRYAQPTYVLFSSREITALIKRSYSWLTPELLYKKYKR
jgi:hypothetical protein